MVNFFLVDEIDFFLVILFPTLNSRIPTTLPLTYPIDLHLGLTYQVTTNPLTYLLFIFSYLNMYLLEKTSLLLPKPFPNKISISC